jgi:hypothetical protein
VFGTIRDFTADQFTPTRWEKSDKKANFGKQFIRFVEADFDRAQFPHTFYVRLALSFGNIAHFNESGFYDVFFTTTQDKLRFLRLTLLHTPCGDPAFTYSDVERALQSWLFQNGVLEKYEQRLAKETEAVERAELARLKGKYENGPAREAG